MSSTSSPNLTDFINRGVAMLRDSTDDGGLFPALPSTNPKLVTAVLAQEPPIDQSPNNAVIPVIYVGYSRNPIRRMEYIGRDGRITDGVFQAGAKNYFLEFYNVIITREITKEASQIQCQKISNIVRDVYQNNLTMVDTGAVTPAGTQIAATNEVIPIPVVLKTDNVTIQAINVICRPQVRVSLRTVV